MESWKREDLKEKAKFAIAVLNCTLDETVYQSAADDCECSLDDYIQNQFENAMAEFPDAAEIWVGRYQKQMGPSERWKLVVTMVEKIERFIQQL